MHFLKFSSLYQKPDQLRYHPSSMLVPYDRRYPYCSGLAVHPSVVAAESKARIFCIVAMGHLPHVLIKRA